MFEEFFENKMEISRLNYGTITLIPKLKEANQIQQYKPICLLNVMFKIFSKKILKLKKYFWYFCKKGKVLEKFQHAENNFENFKHVVGKTNEVKGNWKGWRKQIWDKYHFTFGKGASFIVRCARLFSTILTIGRLILENWTKPNSRPSATPSLPSSFF